MKPDTELDVRTFENAVPLTAEEEASNKAYLAEKGYDVEVLPEDGEQPPAAVATETPGQDPAAQPAVEKTPDSSAATATEEEVDAETRTDWQSAHDDGQKLGKYARRTKERNELKADKARLELIGVARLWTSFATQTVKKMARSNSLKANDRYRRVSLSKHQTSTPLAVRGPLQRNPETKIHLWVHVLSRPPSDSAVDARRSRRRRKHRLLVDCRRSRIRELPPFPAIYCHTAIKRLIGTSTDVVWNQCLRTAGLRCIVQLLDQLLTSQSILHTSAASFRRSHKHENL